MANSRWMLLAGMQGLPVLCSGHAVQKWIATLARFNKAIPQICTKLHLIGTFECSNRIRTRIEVFVRCERAHFVGLLYRTERSMIFPRCWPRPCALINPANHISAEAHYSGSLIRNGTKCEADVSVAKRSSCSWLWFFFFNGKCGCGHCLHYAPPLYLICPDQLSIRQGFTRRFNDAADINGILMKSRKFFGLCVSSRELVQR